MSSIGILNAGDLEGPKSSIKTWLAAGQ